MQFFNFNHVARYRRLEIHITSLFSQALANPDMASFDISNHLLTMMHTIKESKKMKGMSMTKRNLGAPLVLTRIAYQAIRAIDYLPPPLQVDLSIPTLKLGKPKTSTIREDKKDSKRKRSYLESTGSQRSMRG